MFDNFRVVKKIRRFGKNISIVEKGNVRIQIIEDDKYISAYEKLYSMIGWLHDSVHINIQVTYAGEEFISFLCTEKTISFTLNYFLKTGCFERDSIVLRQKGINKKSIARLIKENGEVLYRKESGVYMIHDGIGVLCGKDGRKSIKIRKL